MTEYLSGLEVFDVEDGPDWKGELWPFLHQSSWYRTLPVITLLADKYKFNLDLIQDCRALGRYTPLLWGIKRDHLESIQELLKFGADPRVGGVHGDREYQDAVEFAQHLNSREEIVQILQKRKDGEMNGKQEQISSIPGARRCRKIYLERNTANHILLSMKIVPQIMPIFA